MALDARAAARKMRALFPAPRSSLPSMSLSPEARKTLSGITTATITTVLLKKGLRNVWMRGARPLRPGLPRLNSTVTALSPLGRRRGEGSVAAMISRTRPFENVRMGGCPASRKCARKSNKLMLGEPIRPCYRDA